MDTNNAKLIYKYTKDNVKEVSLSIDRVTKKLELVLVFDIKLNKISSNKQSQTIYVHYLCKKVIYACRYFR